MSLEIGLLEKQALKEIRLESLDPFNRIRSIYEDSKFVESVISQYPSYPAFANLRCGAWYVDPTISRSEPVYFKSTDGHIHNWSFNLRRPNLHLLPPLMSSEGIILVDSTRSGKRLPDALSKTIPIWCTVINRAVSAKEPPSSHFGDKRLYLPPSVSDSEKSQIESKLDGWVEALMGSSYVLPSLAKPLRPIWIGPSITSAWPIIDQSSPFYPVICISASRVVENALERRSESFTYVQGAGDDHESWSRGLTPSLFWKYKQELISSDQEEINEKIARIVALSTLEGGTENDKEEECTPIIQTGSRISLSNRPSLPENTIQDAAEQQGRHAFIVISSDELDSREDVAEDAITTLRLRISPHISKASVHQKAFLADILPRAASFALQQLSTGSSITISCTQDDIAVGVALALLNLYFDSEGQFKTAGVLVTKEVIKRRLEWILAERPQSNPPRWVLRRVNEFLMSGHHNATHRTAQRSANSME